MGMIFSRQRDYQRWYCLSRLTRNGPAPIIGTDEVQLEVTAMVKLHVLGAGTPTPTPTRFGSAYVVQVGNEYLMFDCGPAATHKLVQAGLFPTMVDYLFFTHHHFDHDVDYPCFLLCRWDQSVGKENELQIFGPTLTERITEGILGENGLFAHDWKARVNHPLSQRIHVNRGGTLPRKPPSVKAKDVGLAWSTAVGTGR